MKVHLMERFHVCLAVSKLQCILVVRRVRHKVYSTHAGYLNQHDTSSVTVKRSYANFSGDTAAFQ